MCEYINHYYKNAGLLIYKLKSEKSHHMTWPYIGHAVWKMERWMDHMKWQLTLPHTENLSHFLVGPLCHFLFNSFNSLHFWIHMIDLAEKSFIFIFIHISTTLLSSEMKDTVFISSSKIKDCAKQLVFLFHLFIKNPILLMRLFFLRYDFRTGVSPWHFYFMLPKFRILILKWKTCS